MKPRTPFFLPTQLFLPFLSLLPLLPFLSLLLLACSPQGATEGQPPAGEEAPVEPEVRERPLIWSAAA